MRLNAEDVPEFRVEGQGRVRERGGRQALAREQRLVRGPEQDRGRTTAIPGQRNQ